MINFEEREPSEWALGIAARCWCDKDTSSTVMDVKLATAFAKRLDFLLEGSETAWGLIANADVANWDNYEAEWTVAAIKWREEFIHKLYDERPEDRVEDEDYE